MGEFMIRQCIFVMCLMMFTLVSDAARAEFVITSAIIEFTKDTPSQQDIEIVSRGRDSDYVVAEVTEVLRPGASDETRVPIVDMRKSRLLVTPDRMILAGGNRKIIRFVLLKPLDDQEHIYRVAIKPVIKGIENNSKVGLKILLGYEVLVILRPASMAPRYTVKRDGNRITLTNSGNTNIVLQNGQQCVATNNCVMPPTLRAYAGQVISETLPQALPVTYTIWDGQQSVETAVP